MFRGIPRFLDPSRWMSAFKAWSQAEYHASPMCEFFCTGLLVIKELFPCYLSISNVKFKQSSQLKKKGHIWLPILKQDIQHSQLHEQLNARAPAVSREHKHLQEHIQTSDDHENGRCCLGQNSLDLVAGCVCFSLWLQTWLGSSHIANTMRTHQVQYDFGKMYIPMRTELPQQERMPGNENMEMINPYLPKITLAMSAIGRP